MITQLDSKMNIMVSQFRFFSSNEVLNTIFANKKILTPDMRLLEVIDDRLAAEFIHLPRIIYKNYAAWIQPLDKDIKEVFDPNQNKFFARGECIRWILQTDKGQTIGRIAAFYDKKAIEEEDHQPTGGIGFFECINDQQAANILFNASKKWLIQRKLEAMDGPINFGLRNRWWGLLSEGYHLEPNYLNNYNPPYYHDLFTNYGFKNYYEQLTFGRNIDDPLPEIVEWKAKRLLKNPNYTFRHIEKKNLDKYIEDFQTIYNQAWEEIPGAQALTKEEAKAEIEPLLPILDEKIIWFGYHGETPACFFIMIPEVNQIFKYVNGKMNLLGKLKFLYHLKRGSCRKIQGVIFGVAPAFQKKGLEAALLYSMKQTVQVEHRVYDNMELNWIADFNPRMIHLLEQVGTKLVKKHITYRKLFDESKPFSRAPIVSPRN